MKRRASASGTFNPFAWMRHQMQLCCRPGRNFSFAGRTKKLATGVYLIIIRSEIQKK